MDSLAHVVPETQKHSGYVHTTSDHAVFVHQNGECIAFHVDDMLTMARGLVEMACMKEENAGCFETKDLGKSPSLLQI